MVALKRLSRKCSRTVIGNPDPVAGSLDPAEVQTLLDGLYLPADTEHLPELRKGVANR